MMNNSTKIGLLLLCGVLAVVTIAQAQGTTDPAFLSGRRYQQVTNRLAQTMYILGVLDLLNYQNTNPQFRACLRQMFPVGTTLTEAIPQVHAIMDRYLQAHPEMWHGVMAEIVALAFIEVCKL